MNRFQNSLLAFILFWVTTTSGLADDEKVGTTIKVAGIKSTEADLAEYKRYLNHHYAEKWSPPRSSEPHVTVVSFTIHHDGHTSDCRVLDSSGIATFDQAAIYAVAHASPVKFLKGESQPIEVKFRYAYSPLLAQ